MTRARLYVRRFLGEDVSEIDIEELFGKLEEARVVREFEVNLMAEAIARVFGRR